MNDSIYRRWMGRWTADAGLACLGAGCIWVSGCTTPLTAESTAPAKKDQQVAKTAGSSADKKAAPKVAAKEAAGKARVSDMDGSSQTRLFARKTPPSPTEPSVPPWHLARKRRNWPRLTRKCLLPRSRALRMQMRKPSRQKHANPRRLVPPRPPLPAKLPPQFAPTEMRSSRPREMPKQPAITAMKKTESKRPAAQRAKPEPQAADGEMALASNHQRRRADRLMQRAHEMYRSGYPEEALRLASVAVELEKSRQAVYLSGEERPPTTSPGCRASPRPAALTPP